MTDLQKKLIAAFDQLDAELKRSDPSDVRLEMLYLKIKTMESHL